MGAALAGAIVIGEAGVKPAGNNRARSIVGVGRSIAGNGALRSVCETWRNQWKFSASSFLIRGGG